MEVSGEQQPAPVAENVVVASEHQQQPQQTQQNEHSEEAMEEGEGDYSYEGDEYRHFMPRGRGGFG